MSACTDCGMVVKEGEYHPFAACALFRALAGNAVAVRENVGFVAEHGAKQERARFRKRLEAMLAASSGTERDTLLTVLDVLDDPGGEAAP